jgi:hypothetical protein
MPSRRNGNRACGLTWAGYAGTMKLSPSRSGRVARPFPFPCHKILSARHSNVIPLHSLRVKILKLGCPVLDAFSRAGLLMRLACANIEMRFSMKERKSKAPPVTQRDRWGTRSSKSKAGPPARPTGCHSERSEESLCHGPCCTQNHGEILRSAQNDNFVCSL